MRLGRQRHQLAGRKGEAGIWLFALPLPYSGQLHRQSESSRGRRAAVKFTGERVIPGECEPDLLNEHMARYRFAQRFAAGKVVLDAACGSGYGAAMLAENAKKVVGCDISHEAVEYARRVYGASKGGALRVEYSESDCLALPFPSARFDLVVAFEIIEHLENPQVFLKEMDRVLGPGGILIVSTPNRLY